MGWITDKKPPSQEQVLVSVKDDSGDTPYYFTTCGWHYENIWIVNDEVCFMVNGWMPLPKPLTN